MPQTYSYCSISVIYNIVYCNVVMHVMFNTYIHKTFNFLHVHYVMSICFKIGPDDVFGRHWVISVDHMSVTHSIAHEINISSTF